MVLDNTAVKTMAQTQANMSGKPFSIYQRKNGEYIFCQQGMVAEIKKYLPVDERLQFIETVEPKSEN